MNHTVKYITLNVYYFIMLLIFTFGMLMADASLLWSFILMSIGAGMGYVSNIEKQIDFIEAYDRAWSIKMIRNKSK